MHATQWQFSRASLHMDQPCHVEGLGINSFPISYKLVLDFFPLGPVCVHTLSLVIRDSSIEEPLRAQSRTRELASVVRVALVATAWRTWAEQRLCMLDWRTAGCGEL